MVNNLIIASEQICILIPYRNITHSAIITRNPQKGEKRNFEMFPHKRAQITSWNNSKKTGRWIDKKSSSDKA